MASLEQASADSPSLDIEQLRRFHQTHFPGREVPGLPSKSQAEVEGDIDDGLGHYADGVKRTLTDEQIQMFRHSEIQRLLSERKQAQSRRKEDQRRKRRQEKRAARPPRFDDKPAKGHDNVDELMYDDGPGEEQDQLPPGGKMFLWPVLGS